MHTQVVYAPAFQKPSGGMYLSTDQLNLVSGSTTLVILDSIFTSFVDGIEDVINHRIVINKSGLYFVFGSIGFINMVDSRVYGCTLHRNGNASPFAEDIFPYHAPATGSGFTVSTGRVIHLDLGDYVDLRAYHLAGVNTIDITDAQQRTFLIVQRVR